MRQVVLVVLLVTSAAVLAATQRFPALTVFQP